MRDSTLQQRSNYLRELGLDEAPEYEAPQYDSEADLEEHEERLRLLEQQKPVDPLGGPERSWSPELRWLVAMDKQFSAPELTSPVDWHQTWEPASGDLQRGVDLIGEMCDGAVALAASIKRKTATFHQLEDRIEFANYIVWQWWLYLGGVADRDNPDTHRDGLMNRHLRNLPDYQRLMRARNKERDERRAADPDEKQKKASRDARRQRTPEHRAQEALRKRNQTPEQKAAEALRKRLARAAKAGGSSE